MADVSIVGAGGGGRPPSAPWGLPSSRGSGPLSPGGRCPQGAALLPGPRLSQVPAPLNLLGGSLSAAFALSVSLIRSPVGAFVARRQSLGWKALWTECAAPGSGLEDGGAAVGRLRGGCGVGPRCRGWPPLRICPVHRHRPAPSAPEQKVVGTWGSACHSAPGAPPLGALAGLVSGTGGTAGASPAPPPRLGAEATRQVAVGCLRALTQGRLLRAHLFCGSEGTSNRQT